MKGSTCSCGKPLEHLAADPESQEWACRVPSVDRMTGRIEVADAPRATVDEAIAAWEGCGPTSLVVSLMADALYGVREAVSGRSDAE